MIQVIGLFFLGVSLALIVLFLGVVAYAQWEKYEARRTRNQETLRLP